MNYRDEKSEAQVIMQDYLRVLRGQFYGDNQRRFYLHQFMLMQAIAYPAKSLGKMGVALPGDRIREILDEIIKGIKQKGNTGIVEHFGGYFLTCVQSHMKIRQEHYYNEAKTALAKAVSSMPLKDILKGAAALPEAPEETPAQICERLVEIAAAFKPRRKAKKVENQLSFL